MARAGFICAVCLLGVLAGCYSDDRLDEGVESPMSSPPPVNRWAANALNQREPYLRAARRIDPALDDPGLLLAGPTICRGMFELRTDDELVQLARGQIRELLRADVTAVQAAELVVTTNNFVCPDLAR